MILSHLFVWQSLLLLAHPTQLLITRIKHETAKSSVQFKSLAPEWGDTFSLAVHEGSGPCLDDNDSAGENGNARLTELGGVLHVMVEDFDRVSGSDFMGELLGL